MNATHDIAAICAAIDRDEPCPFCDGSRRSRAGGVMSCPGCVEKSDAAGWLSLLADALEEAGDPRAAGLREAVTFDPPLEWEGLAGKQYWFAADALIERLGRERLLRCERASAGARRRLLATHYSRSAAYLALGEALAGA